MFTLVLCTVINQFGPNPFRSILSLRFLFLTYVFFSHHNVSVCISPSGRLLLLHQPSSSTNALVLSGACDPPEPAPPAPADATATATSTAPVLVPSTVTETETATELETRTTSSSLRAFAPSFFSGITPAPIRHAPPLSSYSTPSITTTAAPAATTADADMDGIATPSFMYHAASSSLSAPGNSPLRNQSFSMFHCLAGTR